ncbi:hypothetical protein [Marivita hallyeonensis]|uniref:Uncharacterized protein n=1 Tax=Marivita hallyeonensis TaxID=996342 RepID=A0A1M5MG82_9RHOB|nr:hypothetical protein [Marivita hallyeonensis]SHG76424.1 hypothetical protein SAMN05443551_0511 [Marivita hallyeonensis]
MTHVTRIAFATAALAAVAGCVETTETVGQPAVGSASDLSAFEGARAGQAEMGIQNLGYELIRTEGLTAYWFNRETGACAEITTSDGRYSDVTMLPAEDC